MEDVYGSPCDAHEPAPTSCKADGDAIVIRFDKPIELREGQPPEAVAEEGVVPCCAEIADEYTLRLIPQSAADTIQYAAAGWFVPSIFGKNGLPVAPFRISTKA